ncbi:unnamed protein product, partial [Discosporangium mesarthrocarpum]
MRASQRSSSTLTLKLVLASTMYVASALRRLPSSVGVQPQRSYGYWRPMSWLMRCSMCISHLPVGEDYVVNVGSSSVGSTSDCKEKRKKRKEEMRLKRRAAREARRANVGRAKSIRIAGSPNEDVGLEALLPPHPPPPGAREEDMEAWRTAVASLPPLPEASSGPFTVLGIETSCDDTGAAVIRSDGVILGEALVGQSKIHEQWGGVVPGLARDAHALCMDKVVKEALGKAGMTSAAEVDAIAAT